jgi:hypothetical protein
MPGSFDLLIVGLTERHPERSEGTLKGYLIAFPICNQFKN